MPGPPPTPTKILEARGSKLVKGRAGEPQSDGLRPECPDILAGVALMTWEKIVGRLEAMKILDSIDAELIAGYCLAWEQLHYATTRRAGLFEAAAKWEKSRARGAAARLERVEKQIWRTEITWHRAYTAFIKAADRLGVGAAARARVKVEPGQGEGGGDDMTGPKLAADTIP